MEDEDSFFKQYILDLDLRMQKIFSLLGYDVRNARHDMGCLLRVQE
jgi:hypothetical protein